MSNEAQLAAGVMQVEDLIRRKLVSFAEQRASELLKAHPDDPRALKAMFEAKHAFGDYVGAAECVEKFWQVQPANTGALEKVATAYLRSGNRDKAFHYCGLFMEKTQNSALALFTLADIYERNNMVDELEETIARIEKTKDYNRDRFAALRSRFYMQRKDYDKAIEYAKNAIAILEEQPVTHETDQRLIDLWFQLTKANDRMGAYDEAWACAETAHAIAPVAWDTLQIETRDAHSNDIFTKEMLPSLAHASESDSEPLFIVGNPRSGTSLMEQILSMHPDVANGGEMSISGRMQARMPTLTDSFLPWPQCLLDLRVEDANALAREYEEAQSVSLEGSKRTVTNKALNLIWQLGMLSLIMPKSRAIMLKRHPLDNCVSCFTTNLLAAGHVYTSSLDVLGKIWISRREWQDKWTEILEIPTMELHYENLVDNQEAETRRLLSFLDLPWEDRCLQFHKSKRVAATISYDQVNKKIYKTSSGRWKNYEKHLGPLIDILGDYL